jgi:hypothetical protein
MKCTKEYGWGYPVPVVKVSCGKLINVKDPQKQIAAVCVVCKKIVYGRRTGAYSRGGDVILWDCHDMFVKEKHLFPLETIRPENEVKICYTCAKATGYPRVDPAIMSKLTYG